MTGQAALLLRRKILSRLAINDLCEKISEFRGFASLADGQLRLSGLTLGKNSFWSVRTGTPNRMAFGLRCNDLVRRHLRDQPHRSRLRREVCRSNFYSFATK